ncbi:hypothetical protein HNO88_003206 [Novosphingobium chloroacetimidivorans]|uniref:Uncharacterized protein n=1 Tax=Novosphingobium chloroacetimidivorans TaxID=1428314 RepID=A0A7W7KCU6_9SPHN|nr:hypothetical protein [Novosphingobium chloroacetimidivorans]MBB4859873.1 hypothetical protein [Novosphingobium chloroacetimidivorans]
MNASARRLRGQPLVVLGALLLGWTGARITSFSEGGLNLPEAVLTVGTATAAAADVRLEPRGAGYYVGPLSYPSQAYPLQVYAAPPTMFAPRVQYVPVYYGAGPMQDASAVRPSSATLAASDGSGFYPGFPQDRPIAAFRREEQFGTFATSPLPAAPARLGEPGTLLGGRMDRLTRERSRWSGDFWALLRKDNGFAPAAGTLPATYGASQTGAVFRYRLSRQDAHRPTVYARTTTSLGAIQETSAALGFSGRPLPAIPIVAAIEGRVTDTNGSRRVQPAVLAVTEVPPLALPGALRAEVYGQAGYVGGRYATPFADGQVRVDRSLLTVGRIEARVGGGAWGGIQKGASRLDAGPGATVTMPLTSKMFGRVALDYRFRVAGNAEPDSGPALTVATGF